MPALSWIFFLIAGAARNLWRAPRRTVISLVAIAAAAASLIVFQSFVEGVRTTFRHNVITSQFGHYQIRPLTSLAEDGSETMISPSDAESLRAAIESEVGELAFMSRQQEFFGLISNGDRSTGGLGRSIDAEEERKFLTLTEVHEGKHLADEGEDSIFLGVDFAVKAGAKVGDVVTLVVTNAQGSINALDLTVVGTFKSGVVEMDSGMYFIHRSAAEKLNGTAGAERILIGFKNDNELQYQASLNAMLKQRFPATKAVHWRDLATYFDNTMGWLDSIFSVFRVIIILIATLSIVNVFTITLLERTGEFGTLRAIGTRRSEITAMIIVEGLMQSVLGSVVGAASGISAIALLKDGVSMPPPLLMTTPFHVGFAVPWTGVLFTAMACVAVAGSAGLWPAMKMARVNIVTALGRNV